MRLNKTVLVEVYQGSHLVHNALCRTLADVAAASQGKEFRLIPPDSKTQANQWEEVYDSYENQVALGRAE